MDRVFVILLNKKKTISIKWGVIVGFLLLSICSPITHAQERIKDLARFSGWRENQLIGYGLVTGLSGSGDTSRSQVTQQSLANMLKQFAINISPTQLNSRNVAAVMITAELPPLAEPGSRIDVTVTSIGDARSLSGGSLLQTPLMGSDGKVYALAQGALSVGGYRYESHGSRSQKNHPTVGRVPSGAIVERAVKTQFIVDGYAELFLTQPDFTTARRIAEAINKREKKKIAHAIDASKVKIILPDNPNTHTVDLLSRIENIRIQPDERSRVVINERTGTVAAGGNVLLSAVTVVHGNLKVAIDTEYSVSQPNRVFDDSGNIRTVVIPETTIQVQEKPLASIQLKGQSTIADLVGALNKINATPRDMIAVLQAIHAAGALRAEIVIQ